MANIRFSAATQDDVAAITDCIAAAYAEARETLADLPDVTADVAQEVADNRVVLAWLGDMLAGVIIFARRGDAMKIINLAVSPDGQGQGIAGKLLARVEAEAHADGCTAMELRTHRQMQKTRAIYSHLGWVETEVSGNSVAMRKDL